MTAADPRVRDEVSALLAWLAARADDTGTVTEPVQIASGLLARLCGDRRVIEGDQRRRATTIALAELERLGVLTMAREYVVGKRGRCWSCWYVFGSGRVPRIESLPADRWAALGQASSVANTNDADREPSATATIDVLVVGERDTPEGLVRVLSDGSRGAARTMLVPAPTVESPTATYAYRPPWFARRIERSVFTPGELLRAPVLVTLPDVIVRRRMTRRERLVWGGGGGDGSPPPILQSAK